VQLLVPIRGEDQERAVKLFGFRIDASRRIRRITVPVDNFRDFPVLDARGAVPGLHDKFVACLDVAENDQIAMRTGKTLRTAGIQPPSSPSYRF